MVVLRFKHGVYINYKVQARTLEFSRFCQLQYHQILTLQTKPTLGPALAITFPDVDIEFARLSSTFIHNGDGTK